VPLDPTILHIDINNFYASVAIKNNPVLRGKPVIICGDPEKRHGIVLAKSEEAKKKGVRTGETIFEAKRKCQNLIMLPPDFKQYAIISAQAYEIYKSFTPNVESFGLDECWLDVTGCEKISGGGKEIADKIRDRVREELGITVSVGVSFTKVFAKLGSDLKKPDATTVIDRENYQTVVWPLPVRELLYVGASTVEKLKTRGILTIGDVVNAGQGFLTSLFGKVGEKLYLNSAGLDGDAVSEHNTSYLPESISNGTTLESDITDIKSATSLIFSLSELVAFRMRGYSLRAHGVALYLRYSDFKHAAKQSRLPTPSDDAIAIADEAVAILKQIHNFNSDKPIRSITIGTHSLRLVDNTLQTSLFDEKQAKNVALDTKMDKIRKKYGYDTITRAIEIEQVKGGEIKGGKVERGHNPLSNPTHV
jgi:DNA polymerase-4